MEDIFICPECGAKFKRNSHYISIINLQSLITFEDIIDMCCKCNYISKKNKEMI